MSKKKTKNTIMEWMKGYTRPEEEEKKNDRRLRELSLFAGIGGGILGGRLLGWRTVCAVEINEYCRRVLRARQRDGVLPEFPIYVDVRERETRGELELGDGNDEFCAREWRGRCDVVSGGFPCQDISVAKQNAKGLEGERSGLWREFARIIGEVEPPIVFIENSPQLVNRGLARVLEDLARSGYDAAWDVVSAGDCGASHERKRLWIVGRRAVVDADGERCREVGVQNRVVGEAMGGSSAREFCGTGCAEEVGGRRRFDRAAESEPRVCRTADDVSNRLERLRALGNAQVPLVAAVAFTRLFRALQEGGKQ